MRDWEQRLAAAGCRVTAPRRAVIEVLLGAEAPLAPQEVCARAAALHARHNRPGLVTVYRTLALLEELGLVRRVHRDDGCHAYLPTSPGHRHAILCRSCGQAAEFRGDDDLAALARRVQRATGYRVEDHLLQLVGLCPACQQGR